VKLKKKILTRDTYLTCPRKTIGHFRIVKPVRREDLRWEHGRTSGAAEGLPVRGKRKSRGKGLGTPLFSSGPDKKVRGGKKKPLSRAGESRRSGEKKNARGEGTKEVGKDRYFRSPVLDGAKKKVKKKG